MLDLDICCDAVIADLPVPQPCLVFSQTLDLF